MRDRQNDPEFRERVRKNIEKWGISTGPGPARSEEDRARVMGVISRAWREHPEYRFGQLLDNAVKDAAIPDLFYVEDEALMRALEHKSGEHGQS